MKSTCLKKQFDTQHRLTLHETYLNWCTVPHETQITSTCSAAEH